MWTAAMSDLCLPSSQNHSAILHSAPQLLLPLPIGFPNCSSWHEGPKQAFLCLRLLTGNLISYKEQLRAMGLYSLGFLFSTTTDDKSAPTHHLRAWESLFSSRVILPDGPLFLHMPPNSTAPPMSPSPYSYLSFSHLLCLGLWTPSSLSLFKE